MKKPYGGFFGTDPDTSLVYKKDFTKFLKACSRQDAVILHGNVVVIQNQCFGLISKSKFADSPNR